MIVTSKPNSPFYHTDALEALARALFNGAMPKLSGDNWKRRRQIAKELCAAHLAIPGVCKPDPAALEQLAPAYRAIAASRQARVDVFLAGLVPKPTASSVRQQLVSVLGEQALQLRLFNARHSIAAALALLGRLEGRATPLDLGKCDAQQFAAKLDDALPGARQHFYPDGNVMHSLRGLDLLSELADAVAESKAGTTTAAPPARTAPAPTRVTRESLAAAIRSEPDAHIRAALYQHFVTLADQP